MMETYGNLHIQEMPLSSPFFHSEVERFLLANGLRMETLDSYFTLQNTDGDILAGAGLKADVLKCLAVSAAARSEGLAAPLVSRVISVAASKGITNLKVFTKPEHQALFESLGFRLLASAPEAILLENGRGLEQYCQYLRGLSCQAGSLPIRSGVTTAPASLSCPAPTGHPRVGVVVMNANPFTLGHQYLLEQAAAQVDTLYVIPVKEDVSLFSYEERLAMIHVGAPKGIIVTEGSCYQISALTFPTYFLKDLSQAAQTQMRLDIDLFACHIAPALGATVRFVGSEPYDALTARYNELMKEPLNVVEIPRLTHSGPTPCLAETSSSHSDRSEESVASTTHVTPAVIPSAPPTVIPSEASVSPVSASQVRSFLAAGDYTSASSLVPATTRPYLLAHLACSALQRELNCPLKPGLVGPDSNGSHADMDYALMQRSISALRPWFVRMAQASSAKELQQLGMEAEKAMLKATGGVNTHRGAIFAMGLTLYVRGADGSDTESLMQNRLADVAQSIFGKILNNNTLSATHGSLAKQQFGVKGARDMAEEGYRQLFADWLPAYRSFASAQDDRKSAQVVRENARDESGKAQDDGNYARGDKENAQEGGNNCQDAGTVIPSEASESRLHMLLLRIMSTLDDTCVIHRVGYNRAQEVKREASALLESFSKDGLKRMCDKYAAEGISPGGAADMMALTLLMDTIIKR